MNSVCHASALVIFKQPRGVTEGEKELTGLVLMSPRQKIKNPPQLVWLTGTNCISTTTAAVYTRTKNSLYIPHTGVNFSI